MKKVFEFMKNVLTIVLVTVLVLGALVLFSNNEDVLPELPNEDGDGTTVEDGSTNGSSNNRYEGMSKVNVDFSDKVYCAFGDSITYGSDSSNSYKQLAHPYPSLVAEILHFDSTVNKGVSGATFAKKDNIGNGIITSYVLSLTGTNDVISVMGGVNDYMLGTPLGSSADRTSESVYGSLYLIAEYLTTNYPNSFIFFMTPYKAIIKGADCLTNNTAGYNLSDVAYAIQYVAKSFNIPVLDMYNYGQYETVELGTANSDGCHPSQDFVTNYTAPHIVEFIEYYYKSWND